MLERYAADIDLTATVLNRMRVVLEMTASIIDEPYTHVLVRESNAPGEPRAFTRMTVFSEHFICEFKDFLSALRWDVTSLNDIFSVDVTANAFDFEAPKADSILSIDCVFHRMDFHWGWQGFGKNCAYGTAVLREILLPIIRRRAADGEQVGK